MDERRQHIPPELRPYMEAQESGNWAGYYHTRLLGRRGNYSDELPEEDVRNVIQGDRFTQYKCQGNYIVGTSLDLRGALENGVITDEEVKEQIEKMLKHDFSFSKGKFTTREEIDLINQTLNSVIKHLGSKL